ncbi:MAG: NAD(P)/FAD-dependent oxidoreductase [Bacteroidales bacterium]|nr:NAD(P)/FAD-dependent oxidoreductase [Candidatus Cryptobacteroides fimicaballi]
MHLLIIGAGPGGYETAVEAARRGLEVTLVTDGPLGGTCLNEGCIPTKTLIHSCCEQSLDIGSALERKASVVSQLQSGIEGLLRNVEVIYGKASFVDVHTVRVGDKVVSADKIIIATGSVSAFLPVPGSGLALDSSQLLNLDQVPRKLVIIG